MDPVIRNVRDNFDGTKAARLINLDDNPPTCTLTYSEIPPNGTSAHHIHEWEHVVYVLEGTATLVCGGKDYTVSQGDAILVPPNEHHQWKNESQAPVIRVTYNPVASESADH